MKIIKTAFLLLFLALASYNFAYSEETTRNTAQQNSKPTTAEDTRTKTTQSISKTLQTKSINESSSSIDSPKQAKSYMYKNTKPKVYPASSVNDGNSGTDEATNAIINAATQGMFNMMKYDPSQY